MSEKQRPILSTEDLSIFEKHPLNRCLKPIPLKKLEKAIKEKNDLDLWPIMVDKLLRVANGWHRVSVAKKLKLRVYYSIYEDSEIERILRDQAVGAGKWEKKDDLNREIQSGNQECIKLQGFMNIHNLDLGYAILILTGQKLFSSEFDLSKFKFPSYQDLVKILEKREEMLKIIDYLHEKLSAKEGDFMLTKKFYQALQIFFSSDLVDIQKFFAKLKKNTGPIKHCPSLKEYLDTFKTVYTKNGRRGEYDFLNIRHR